VLKNINIVISPGEKIGIVGRTGSGKSSLMLGLLRIIEASAGKIYIDGIDTGTLSLEELRSNMNIILQEHFLFTGTIRDNVDPTHSFSN
jgi:ABC-type multidrug transport system fused ATPase/permease subunit